MKDFFIGIDIGSTAAKVAIFKNETLIDYFTEPTGWSSIETAKKIKEKLLNNNITETNSNIIATGYGRISVPYADKVVTEITCHAMGAKHIFNENDMTVIDIGGQDTKIISIDHGVVNNFFMNDKCSAGTGRFLEVMSNILGITIDDLSLLAQEGKDTSISSMCTVFAESEVISLIGQGTSRENISFGIINSVINKVISMCNKTDPSLSYCITGGLCDNPYVISELSKKLNVNVKSNNLGRFAGAIGAALLAKKL
ncbi:acyl-CoA dehydratase activase [uncultured Cetobacterium sp.]|uniref:acyl-CoA dehydratase activase n=2 Tax=uncultured Cetobacterium sp. TaxID=527638 RepID=UPI0026365BE0|nr:acyl-CoA dehydratase activase [uncultured Cetobacterium sp.]